MKIIDMNDKTDDAKPGNPPKLLTLFATPWSESDIQSAMELTQKYIELIGILKILTDQFVKCDNRLDVALQTLVEVKHFIEQDTSVNRYGITEPLGAIAAALRDVKQGIHPKLFEEHTPQNKTKYKDPTATMTVSACAAACMEILMRYKCGLKNSSRFVAVELSKVGITHKHEGGAITADTVRRWRDRMTVKNKTVANALYWELVKILSQALGSDGTLQNAKLLVQSEIQRLATSGTVLRQKKPQDPQ
jgi:hypothetical protein